MVILIMVTRDHHGGVVIISAKRTVVNLDPTKFKSFIQMKSEGSSNMLILLSAHGTGIHRRWMFI